jgi:hypothetical protein
MEEHKIRFGVDGGHSLIGVLTKPTGQWTNNSQKVVVLVHGAMANKNSFYHKHLAEHLTTELGYHTFRYDALGVGESIPIYQTNSSEQFRNMMSGFWENVKDLKSACEFLQSTHGLRVAFVFGHSYGGQLAHMFAVQYGQRFGLEGIGGINMRFDLEYWRETYYKHNQNWVLKFKNRGKLVQHTVTKDDVDLYAQVPMLDVEKITCDVINIYGLIADKELNQANYDTGTKLLTDGVVPFTDVEYPANLIKNHTLKFMEHVGHFYREDGSHEKLWAVLREWLIYMEQRRQPSSTSRL